MAEPLQDVKRSHGQQTEGEEILPSEISEKKSSKTFKRLFPSRQFPISLCSIYSACDSATYRIPLDGETVETVADFILGGLQNHCRW